MSVIKLKKNNNVSNVEPHNELMKKRGGVEEERAGRGVDRQRRTEVLAEPHPRTCANGKMVSRRCDDSLRKYEKARLAGYGAVREKIVESSPMVNK
eukprot:7367239-Heterocapsa_arctica.AAC.1